MVFPISDDNSDRSSFPVVTIALIVINAFVFFVLQGMGQNLSFTYAFSTVPAEIVTGKDLVTEGHVVEIDQGNGPQRYQLPGLQPTPVSVYLTLLTSMFMHGGIAHILGNMWFLWIFGDNIEHDMGKPRYVVFYLLCGLLASLTHVFFNAGSQIPSLGASGAISGVMGAYLILHAQRRVTVLLFRFITQVPGWVAVGLWFGFQIISSVAELSGPASGVAYGAHIGGFIAGAALAKLFTIGRYVEPTGFQGERSYFRRSVDRTAACDSPVKRVHLLGLSATIELRNAGKITSRFLSSLLTSPGGEREINAEVIFPAFLNCPPFSALRSLPPMSIPRIYITRFTVLVAIGLFGLVPLAAQEPPAGKALRAGVAKIQITPWLGVSLNGGMRDREATEIHDDLHARALVLNNGETSLAIVVCDSCMIVREVFDAAKQAASAKTGIKPENMLCSATHAHSAPSSASVFQSDADPRYQKFLTEQVTLAIETAHANLQPAAIGWGTGKAPEHVHNRRWYLKPGTMPPGAFAGQEDQVKMNPPRGSEILDRPAGPIDPVVSLLSVQTADGKPLCLLANYSLHYVGGTGGGHVSADYFGAFSETIAAKLKAEQNAAEEFVAMMCNGTSGDINNINFREVGQRQAPYEQIQYVAESVAAEALRVRSEIKHAAWVPLAVRQVQLTLGVRKPTASEVEEAKKIVAAVEGPIMSSLPEVYARETLIMDKYPEQVELLVQALRIGDCGIAAIPCETFVEIGLELREKSPLKQTFTIELANGYNGYLPTPKHHDLGGYETWRAQSSYLEREASPRIVKELTGMFQELAK